MSRTQIVGTFCFMTIFLGTVAARLPDQKLTERSYQKERWFMKNKNLKFILHWTSPVTKPFYTRQPFLEGNCSVNNCIMLTNRRHLQDLRFFDAIMFHGPDIFYNPSILDYLPDVRTEKQLYIYYSAESADYYPMCDYEFDDLFNLTLSYKLNSDLPAPYLVIRENGVIIGPKPEMHWKKVEDMLPVDADVKKKIEMKSMAVAWLVSICNTSSEREKFVTQLQSTLTHHKLGVDIFGKCSITNWQCGRPEIMLPDCWEMIQTDYYFYLSFENSLDEDYVTEKLLNPLQHYTVPIVYGAANYSRFLPEGSYLDAKQLGPYKLAQEINDIILDKERYYGFFKWRNHYSYHSLFEAPESNPLCRLCALLNKGTWQKRYQNFRDWWNLPGRCPTRRPFTMDEILFL